MKKFIAFVVAFATFTVLLAVPASAALVFNHDFENPPESGKLQDVDDGTVWKPYASSMEGVVTFEDGAVRIDYASEGRPFWNAHYNVPGQDHVLMFDLKGEMANPSLSMQFFMNGTRVIYKSLYLGMEADTWYTFMIVVTGGATKATPYYKVRDDVNAAWTPIDISGDAQNGTRGEHTGTAFKMGFDTSSNKTKTGAIWYDNYTVYSDKWFENQNISLNGAPVETIADVISGGELTVEFEVYDSNITIEDGDFAGNHEAKIIMVALDKNMKMVACNTANKVLKGHYNSVSASLELSDDADAVNYYGNLTDGGKIYFYTWENMQPIFDPIVIE